MKKILTLLLVISLSFVIVACSNKKGVVTQDKFEALEEGMTRAAVKEMFGEPLEQKDNQWTYDLEKDDSIIALHIFFNGEELAGYTTGSK